MTVVKLVGSALLVLAGCYAAHIGARDLKKRLSVTEAWMELIRLIRIQIDCYMLPLDAILASVDSALLSRAGAGVPENTLPALLTRSLPFLDAETERLLSAFVRELGTSYREEQLKRCDYYLAALQSRRDTVAASLPSRQKLCRALCICIAAGSAILLW